MNKNNLSIIILTYNEELHLERCLESIKSISNGIYIVDSFSDDRTLEIAQNKNAKVYQNKWPGNHAEQVNWALETLPIETEWVMRLDADEYLTDKLVEEIKENLENTEAGVNGYILNRRVYFKKKWMKHGGNYPVKLLRMWRNKKALCEQKFMDEHMVLIEGETKEFKYDFIDENLRDISWWTEKHNSYATREMIDTLINKYELEGKKLDISGDIGFQANLKRKFKKIYQNFPLFLRPFIYFFYRYFIKLGILDGKEGLIWNFLQGLWYRFLVDTKIYEVEKLNKKNKVKIKEYLKEEYHI